MQWTWQLFSFKWASSSREKNRDREGDTITTPSASVLIYCEVVLASTMDVAGNCTRSFAKLLEYGELMAASAELQDHAARQRVRAEHAASLGSTESSASVREPSHSFVSRSEEHSTRVRVKCI